jgi:hypothetical protein
MKNFKTLLMPLVTLQLGHAEIFNKDSLVERYREANVETTKAHEIGAYVEAGAATLAGTAAFLRYVQDINVVNNVHTLPMLQARDEMVDIARLKQEMLKLEEKTAVAGTVTEVDSIKMDQIRSSIRDAEANLADLKSSPNYVRSLDHLEDKLLKNSAAVDIDAFFEETSKLSTTERNRVLSLYKKNKGAIRKLITPGLVATSVYLIVDGRTRYILSVEEKRDPTLVPLAGVAMWIGSESAEGAVNVTDSVVEFTTKTVPDKATHAYQKAKESVTDIIESAQRMTREEAEKIRESTRDPSSKE